MFYLWRALWSALGDVDVVVRMALAGGSHAAGRLVWVGPVARLWTVCVQRHMPVLSRCLSPHVYAMLSDAVIMIHRVVRPPWRGQGGLHATRCTDYVVLTKTSAGSHAG